jgi:hypothetical protein
MVTMIDALLIQADPRAESLHPVHGAITPMVVKARFASLKAEMRAEIARSEMGSAVGAADVALVEGYRRK